MFFSVSYDADDIVSSGTFTCPRCNAMARFTTHRITVKRTNIIVFIPLSGVEEVLGQYVRCEACQSQLDPSILLEAEGVQYDEVSAESPLRNVVSLSDAAADEIRRRWATGGFEPGVYVRLVPSRDRSECQVTFDFPYADEEEWLGRSQGLPIVIDRALAEFVMGHELDFDGERFVTR